MTASDQPKVAVIGECMLELNLASQPEDSNRTPAVLAYGGDTLNTSIYLSRLNAKVDYVTALGDDLMSDWMVSQWKAENVGCDHVYREPNAVPGLYMINVDDEGCLLYTSPSPRTRVIKNETATLLKPYI